MTKTEQNVLSHVPDPFATRVRKNRIAEEKNRLMMPNGEVRTCNPE
ncbi:hypothetical protein L0665_03015 [Methanogenium marinum]|uniref:Uncharacterized protein n=1 Tax=Methanogenium marinum TaxID=348610 RepID=A0A9Q4PVI0_9EURY|nr:hypothetical protein [Methanogenium marinum]MDE4907584.1 hypothetical protein [Methanogenium marinum]